MRLDHWRQIAPSQWAAETGLNRVCTWRRPYPTEPLAPLAALGLADVPTTDAPGVSVALLSSAGRMLDGFGIPFDGVPGAAGSFVILPEAAGCAPFTFSP